MTSSTAKRRAGVAPLRLFSFDSDVMFEDSLLLASSTINTSDALADQYFLDTTVVPNDHASTVVVAATSDDNVFSPLMFGANDNDGNNVDMVNFADEYSAGASLGTPSGYDNDEADNCDESLVRLLDIPQSISSRATNDAVHEVPQLSAIPPTSVGRTTRRRSTRTTTPSTRRQAPVAAPMSRKKDQRVVEKNDDDSDDSEDDSSDHSSDDSSNSPSTSAKLPSKRSNSTTPERASASVPPAATHITPASTTTSSETTTDASGQKPKTKRKITPKRQERNRDSARKFRQRKKEYLSTLEEEVRQSRLRARELEILQQKGEEDRRILERRLQELSSRELSSATTSKRTMSEDFVESAMSSTSSTSPTPATLRATKRQHLMVEVDEDEALATPSLSQKNDAAQSTIRSGGDAMQSTECAAARPSTSTSTSAVGQEQPQQQQVPMSTLLAFFAMPQFRALALLVLMAVVVTFMYGPDLNIPMSLPIAHVSLAELRQRLQGPLAAIASSSSEAATAATHTPWAPPSGEADVLAHIATQLSTSSYTAAIGSVLLMTMFDPMQQKWKPYLQSA